MRLQNGRRLWLCSDFGGNLPRTKRSQRAAHLRPIASQTDEGLGGHRSFAYDQIKEAILSGALRPLERITEEQLAERLGLSRTPVREAFGLLAAEGLIVVVAKRGSFVAPLSVDDILEIYQIRTPLECMTARIAAKTIGEEQLAELERLVEIELAQEGTRSVQRSLARSREFRDIVNSCANNKRLEALLKELQSQIHRARALWPSTLGRLSETWREHAQMLEALRARDADAAERLTRTQLERAQEITLAQMTRKAM
jgi:DNA-binding GntR family transcriptional regulator